MSILKELFFSKQRKLVDCALRNAVMASSSNAKLSANCIYHLRLDEGIEKPSLDHSKRLRPFLCLLFGDEGGFDYETMCALATSIELIHNATLIIDDVQDNDNIRCGRTALWKDVGIPEAMNCAFFLASIGQSLYHETQISNNFKDYSSYFHEQFGSLISGQQFDLGGLNGGGNNYLTMIDGKTGALLKLSCVIGAYPFGGTEKQILDIENFAISFSRIHQINDDIDDITKDKLDIGSITNYIEKTSVDNFRKSLNEDLFFQLENLYQTGVVRSDRLRNLVIELSGRHHSQ